MSLSEEKKALRKEIKRKIAIHSNEQLKKHSELSLHHLELDSDFISAKTVMLFWSLPDEIETHQFIEKWCRQKRILLPKIIGNKIYPTLYVSKSQMELGPFNIQQPIAQIFEEEIDLVVVPGQAFDKNGHRLGRGKGFYDRFLTNYHGVKIGLCFQFQFTDYVPYEKFDIPMDKVITG